MRGSIGRKLASIQFAGLMCMAGILCCWETVCAEPVFQESLPVDIRIRFTEAVPEGEEQPAEVETTLLVRDLDPGIGSVFYSIEADGQGWNYQLCLQRPAESETGQDPAQGYDNVEQGALDEWSVLEAQGDQIISLSRTVYIYAREEISVTLAFTDRLGNLYSCQERCQVTALPESQEVVELPAQEVDGEDVPLAEDETSDAFAAEPVTEGPGPAESAPESDGKSEEAPPVETESLDEAPTEPAPESDGETEEALIAEIESLDETPAEPAPESDGETEEALIAEIESLDETPAEPEPESDGESEEAPPTEVEGLTDPELVSEVESDLPSDPIEEASLEDVWEMPLDPVEEATPTDAAEASAAQQSWSTGPSVPQYYYPQTSYSSGYTGYRSGGYTSGYQAAASESSTKSAEDPEAEHDKTQASESSDQKSEQDQEPETKKKEAETHDGSVYDLSEAKDLIGQYWKEIPDLVIYESNAQRVLPESVQVLISRNAEVIELEKDTDYTFQLVGSTADQKTYKYTIYQDNFAAEGAYRVFLSSEDAAGDQNSNEAKDASIWFHIDHTEPLILSVDPSAEQELSGVREVRVRDNTQLSEIEIYLGDQKVDYEEDGELYRFQVPSDAEQTDVRVVARDKAGNLYERTLHNYVQAGTPRVRSGINLVPFGVLAAALAGAGAVVIRRRKKCRRVNNKN